MLEERVKLFANTKIDCNIVKPSTTTNVAGTTLDLMRFCTLILEPNCFLDETHNLENTCPTPNATSESK